MIILIPMGGEGSRFKKEGYKESKPSILTTDRHSGKKLPMIICAMKDMPQINDKDSKIICVDRDFHQINGTEEIIKEYYPQTKFIHDHVLLDQAYGCFLAREFLKSDEELFIGSCDSGFIYDEIALQKAKEMYDVLMISHTNDFNIEANPNAHSWALLNSDNTIKEISLKTPVSSNPMNDHATTGMFWYKRANDFLTSLEEMIWAKDTLNGKYYADKVLNYSIKEGLKVGYFDVKFICWGTPLDYENSFKYWMEFYGKENR